MAALIRGIKNLTRGGIEFAEATTKVLAGATGVFSPVSELGSNVLGFVDRALGGGEKRRSARLAQKPRINYSPQRSKNKKIKVIKKSPKHSKRVAAHLMKIVTTLKSPGRRQK